MDVGAVPPGAFLEFRATDADVMFDDDVGVCTITGAPAIDAEGYVVADAYRCSGQLWGLVVRVVEQRKPPAKAVVHGDVSAPQSPARDAVSW